MNPLVILAVVGYLALEWFAAVWLAALIGWGGVIVVLLALVLVGAAVMRRAGFAAARTLRPTTVDGLSVAETVSAERAQHMAGQVGDAGIVFVAGLLIAVPGLVSSALGLIALIPGVRAVVRSAVASRALRRMRDLGVDPRTGRPGTNYGGSGGGGVVPGEVIRDDQPGPNSGPAHQGPDGHIIEGRVIDPE
ncbi:MAG: FxsA family protein [Actinomycetes bacterium]